MTVEELQTAYKSLRRDKNGPTIKPADIIKQDFGADIDPTTYNENYSDATKNESTQEKTSKPTPNTTSKTEAKNTKSKNKTTQNIYRIKSGDTLGKIARKHGTTVQKLCRLNGLKETSVLQIGQKIKLR
ncbi:MAG: LysM peptidoglycan-binding domain-containing protein [Bacteroidales bacterium]|nr:LysM peptidoglycan-binding domain-containing protein [Candidatus Colimorpha onthohippi]